MINQGMTRLLYFHIPHFREVLLSSFSCDHCGHEDKSVRPAGKIQEKGAKYTLRVDNERDLQRQIVRNDTAVLRIEDLDLEMPTGGSELTNIEGTLLKISTELETGQASRKEQDPALYKALQPIVEKLQRMMHDRSVSFTLSIDDPSGNSFIEPFPEDTGHEYVREDYLRSLEQNASLGLSAAEDPEMGVNTEETPFDSEIVNDVVYTLHDNCPACTKRCQVHVKKVDVPHFKEVMIFATNCDGCGYRTSDVKTGGAVPEMGRKITLKVLTVDDLSRNLLKSETCALSCPELGLHVEPGTLGGRFTTVEGILVQFRDQLWGTVFEAEGKSEGEGVTGGDSMDTGTKKDWKAFFNKLASALKLETTFTIVLEDPMANSYIQSFGDEGPDPQIQTEDYERTEHEKEDLGLNDMVLEGYE